MITKKGYTFIELLVVITVMAILFSLGYANYRDFARQKNLENAARQVEGDLRLAQSMANSGEIPSECPNGRRLYGIMVNVSPSNYYSMYALCVNNIGEPDGFDDMFEIGKNTIGLPPGISMSATNGSLAFLTVGRGVVASYQSGPMIITLTQDATGNTYLIHVEESGNIYVEKGT